MAHWTETIKEERNAAISKCETGAAMITDLAAYLTSPKFHEDTTVQCSDVLRRIEEIRCHLNGTYDS